ncbi:MAG TPA: OsmC family protein [Candidatus Acidoferrales bacterium]|nr:OsmC family protein [Candidatus Acidoferrales bacterium]
MSGHGLEPSRGLPCGALAACTVATLARVARRRRIALARIRVEVSGLPAFAGKSDAEEAAAEGRQVNRQRAAKRIHLEGSLSDAQIAVLERAAKFCPVSQMLAGGLYEFEAEITCSETGSVGGVRAPSETSKVGNSPLTIMRRRLPQAPLEDRAWQHPRSWRARA